MERKLFPIAIALAWVTLPLTAFHYWKNWDRLPVRIAVHFNANWQPNGWTSREGARMLALGTTAFLLLTFTVAASAVRHARGNGLPFWSIIAVFYFTLALVYWVNAWIVDRNLEPGSNPIAAARFHAAPVQGNSLNASFPQKHNYETSMGLHS